MSNKLKLCHLNVRSLLPKLNEFKNIVDELNGDVIGLSETWLSNNIPDDVIKIQGYNFVRKDRQTRGGGVGMYIKNNMKYDVVNLEEINLEQVWVYINIGKKKIAVGTIYRPPTFNATLFLNMFEEVISSLLSTCDMIMCMGDFNLNMLNDEDDNVKKFNSLLDTLGLTQVIDKPTRISRSSLSLLDLLLISDNSTILNKDVLDCDISDHNLIYCITSLVNSNKTVNISLGRDFSLFDYNIFLRDLYSVSWFLIFDMDDIR